MHTEIGCVPDPEEMARLARDSEPVYLPGYAAIGGRCGRTLTAF